MADKSNQKFPKCELKDYVPADKFRTVLPNQRSIPMGITEVAVDIHLRKGTAKKLSFKVPWVGDLFGCLRGAKELKKLLATKNDIESVALTDCDDGFLLIFDTTDRGESVTFSVTQQEVINLLENCRRVPEQRE